MFDQGSGRRRRHRPVAEQRSSGAIGILRRPFRAGDLVQGQNPADLRIDHEPWWDLWRENHSRHLPTPSLSRQMAKVTRRKSLDEIRPS